MKIYIPQLIDLLMDGHNWTREHTVGAYKLLYDIVCSNEMDIEKCSYKNLKSALVYMSELLNGEATITEDSDTEYEARDTILEITKNLKLITEEQIKTIANNFYKA